MTKTGRKRALVAVLMIAVGLGALAIVQRSGSGSLFAFFESHPTVRRVARGACELVGLEGEFDRRFGSVVFYVRFTN